MQLNKLGQFSYLFLYLGLVPSVYEHPLNRQLTHHIIFRMCMCTTYNVSVIMPFYTSIIIIVRPFRRTYCTLLGRTLRRLFPFPVHISDDTTCHPYRYNVQLFIVSNHIGHIDIEFVDVFSCPFFEVRFYTSIFIPVTID